MFAGYMQMTAVQESIWAEDAEQYVADEEEETFSARASGELLLDSLLTGFSQEACAALASASQSHLQHADHLQVLAITYSQKQASMLSVLGRHPASRLPPSGRTRQGLSCFAGSTKNSNSVHL